MRFESDIDELRHELTDLRARQCSRLIEVSSDLLEEILGERERCAKIVRGKRMLQEAYSDPGRKRNPQPRPVFLIAMLWEAEAEILGREPEHYSRLEPATEETSRDFWEEPR